MSKETSAASPLRSWVLALATAALVALAAAVLYLSIYPIRGYDQPRGYDTARYLWRTSCVEAGGVGALRSCAPTTQGSLPGRPGYPIVSLAMAGSLHVSRTTMAAVLPAVLAAAVALAAATLVGGALGTGAGAFLVVAAVVGASPPVIGLITPEGYADALLALTLGVAGLAALAEVAAVGRGRLAASVLLGLMALVHWPTASVIGPAVVVATLAALLRPPAAASSGPAPGPNMVIALAGAGAVWGVGIAAVGSLPDSFPSTRAVFAAKLRSHLPRQGLPVGVPAAAGGLVGVWRGPWPGTVRRWFLGISMAAWVGVVGLAAVAWVAGGNLPLHRFLIVALPVPVLGAIALLWLAWAVGDRSVAAGRAVAVLGCAVVVAAAALLWFHSPRPVLRTDRVRSAAQAGAYLEAAVPPAATVAVVADDPASALDILRQTFRTGIAPQRIAAVTFRRSPNVRGASVVLAARGYTANFDAVAAEHPAGRVAPDVVILTGPPLAPTTGGPVPDTLPSHPLALVSLGLGTFALLLAVGLGWARATLGSLSPRGLAGVAPATGLAASLVGGLAADALGFRLTPGTSLALVVAAGAAGWIVAAAAAWRVRRLHSTDSASPTILSC